MGGKHIAGLLVGLAVLVAMLVAPCPWNGVFAASGTTATESHNQYTVSYNTTGAVALTVAPVGAFKIEQVTYKLSNTSTGNFTIGVDASEGAAYDTTLVTVDVATQGVNYGYRSSDGWLFSEGDECEIAYTNGDSRTVGVKVWYSLLP